MKSVLAILALLVAISAHSGELDDVFAEGVFDTVWGQTYKDMTAQFPSGKREILYGSARINVEDGRPVLGVTRSPESKLVFVFDANNRLSSAGVYFDGKSDFAKLMQKLDSLFGERSPAAGVQGASVIQWRDDQTKLSLTYTSGMFSSETILTIEHLGLEKNTKSKESLGF